MSIISRLKAWFDRLIGRDIWVFETSEDHPEKLERRRVYLVGETEAPWAAAFLCPCGCGEVVRLSLIRDDEPSWIAAGASGERASLHPSIWRIRGCRSHFFIKEGNLVWAKEARPDRRVFG